MIKSIFWITSLFLLAFSAGPVAFLAHQSGRADATDLYLVFSTVSKTASSPNLTRHGAREIGPLRGWLTQMVYAPPSAHASLLKAGFYVLPAGAIAALCGIEPTPKRLADRS